MDVQPGATSPRTSHDKKRPWVRRRIVVDPGLQYRMLLPIGVFAIVQGILLAMTMFYPLYKAAAEQPNQLVQAALFNQVTDIHVCFWTTCFLAALLTCGYTLIRSNRIAGPLYKLRNGLLRMSAGEFDTLKFRTDDELRDFEPVANQLAQRMASIATGNSHRLTYLGNRIMFLKNRLEMQPVSRADVQRELESILIEFGQVHLVESHA